MPPTSAITETALLAELTTVIHQGLSIENPVIEEIEKRDIVPDSTWKLRIGDAAGRPRAVAIVSPDISPRAVAQAVERCRAFKSVLSTELAAAIMEPIASGWMQNRSYVMLPFCEDMPRSGWRGRWATMQLKRPLLDWLCGINRETIYRPTEAELRAGFLDPLEAMSKNTALSDRARGAAQAAIDQSQRGAWSPVHVGMHNDFWTGNVLIDESGVTGRAGAPWRNRFVVIDWGGACVRGYPLYDLLRMSHSLNLYRFQIAAEVRAHCKMLGCEPSGARHHLTAALAYLGVTLDHLPVARYKMLVDNSLAQLESAIGH